MPEPLAAALAEVRSHLLDPSLTRAVAAGRRRGALPSVTRAELRPVALKAGTQLQVVTDDGTRPATRNLAYGPEAESAVDALLAEPFGNWHVEAATTTVQVRVTKKGDAQVHRAARSTPVAGPQQHDRVKQWLLDPGDPLFQVVGGTAAKRRQVDAFLRSLAATLPADTADWPSPLRVVDLGCGNAYLTFAAYRYLTGRGAEVRVVGVDVRDDQRIRNTAVAADLGCADEVTFVAGTIEDAQVTDHPDLVLALHACDTATDQALARAVHWDARWVLAAPCCHHDIAAQLKTQQAPEPYAELTRSPILRERLADVLTDALRAALLRTRGYRVDVVEFVDSAHTPRNLLLRAHRTAAPATAAAPSTAMTPAGATRTTDTSADDVPAAASPDATTLAAAAVAAAAVATATTPDAATAAVVTPAVTPAVGVPVGAIDPPATDAAGVPVGAIDPPATDAAGVPVGATDPAAATPAGGPAARAEYDALTAQWGITPALEKLLA